MNRNDFLEIVDGKSPIKKSTLIEIYELVEMFPYFQSAHLLLLKGLNDSDDVRFNKQLRHSAIHIANREVLYYYLNPILNRAAEKLTDNITSESAITPEPDNSDSNITPDIDNNLMQNNGQSESQDLSSGENRNYESPFILNPDSSENEDQINVILQMDENIEIEEDIFYMDPGFAMPEKEELLELDSELEKASPELSEQIYLTDNSNENELRRQQSELIDKFIIANPRIEPIREKNTLPVTDLSESYMEEEKSGLVTETLARIYINQEYYSKAIGIYEKLNLKYPEKSSYFASQIEKIKENIK